MEYPLNTADTRRLLTLVAAVVRESHPHGTHRVTLDSSLERDLALDSLARVELILRIEREYRIGLPQQTLATAETPRDLLRAVLAAGEQPTHAADHSVADLAHVSDIGTPDKAQTLPEAFAWHVERQPDRLMVHLIEDGAEYPLTYRDIYDAACRWAARLAEAGLQPGQTVAIMLPTSREYLYCFYGVLFAGGIPVPLYPPARLSTIEDHMTRHIGILRSAGAVMLVTVHEARALAYLLRAQVTTLRVVLTPADFDGLAGQTTPAPLVGRGSDIAFLQYTSGSTGNPKGVVLTHQNLLANVRAMGKAVRVTSADVFVSWLPLYHDMGLIGGCFTTMVLGFPVVLMSPLAFLSKPSAWLWAIHRHRGTITGGPNFAYELCLRRIEEGDIEGLDLSSWRFAFNGAEPVSPDTLRAFQDRFGSHGLRKGALAPVYGLAECSVGLAFTPPGEPWKLDRVERDRFTRTGQAFEASPDDTQALQIVCCGRPIAEHDVRVVDASGHEVPDRQEGQLQFRGPSATSGYFRNAEATRSLFADDWLNTGDRAYVSEGSIYITGRDKDIIIRGGRNISPYELEEAVGDMEGIRSGCVAVFGSLDAAQGTERLVVLAETRETDSVRHDALRGEINRLAVALTGAPADEIVLAPPRTVPKTSSGKIRRSAAREYYERGSAAGGLPPVWWQFVRLTGAALLPQVRRALWAAGGALFALRAWLLCAFLLPPTWFACALFPGRRAWSFAHLTASLYFRAAGIRITAHGIDNLPHEGPAVLAANHTSYLDGLVLLALLPWRSYGFVAKAELRESFFPRVLLRGLSALFVKRFEPGKSASDTSELVAAARRGVSLIIFAEGILRRTTGLHPFRTGAFLVAAQAGIPVVPIALRGVRSAMRDGTWWMRRSAVTVTFCAPRRAQGGDWSAAVALREQVRSDVLKHCGEPDLAAPGGAADNNPTI